MVRLMFGWDFEVDAWSRFWRWNLIKICVWTCDKNSTLGSVVPLAMFHFCIQDSRLMDVCRKVWLYFPVWKSGKRREDNAGVRSCKLYQPYPLLQNIFVLSFLSYCSMRKRLLGAKQLFFLDIFLFKQCSGIKMKLLVFVLWSLKSWAWDK